MLLLLLLLLSFFNFLFLLLQEQITQIMPLSHGLFLLQSLLSFWLHWFRIGVIFHIAREKNLELQELLKKWFNPSISLIFVCTEVIVILYHVEAGFSHFCAKIYHVNIPLLIGTSSRFISKVYMFVCTRQFWEIIYGGIFCIINSCVTWQ